MTPSFARVFRLARLVHPSRRIAIAALSLLGAAVYAGCGSGAQDPPPAVGPSPLRRLSNGEYLNALHDLFPSLNPALPDLPADIPVAGFENAAEGQQPSDVRISRYETIANLYADAATADTNAVRTATGCADWSTPTHATSCSAQFIAQTGARLFRRPLTSDERDRYTLKFQSWQSAVDFEGAVRLTLSAMLQSPQFLYRAEPVARTQPPGATLPVEPYAMASRLSFFLWESVPDDVLLQAAARNELATEEQLREQAARMLADGRAKRVLWDFHRQWLGLDRVLLDEHLIRTPQVDPGWTALSQISASTETRLFVQNIMEQSGSLRDILTSRRAWVNGEMARLYGIPAPTNPDAWTEVTLPENERAGLVTRISFLAGYSHRGATSPPVRGNGIQLRFLCELPISPPAGVDLSQPTAAPGQGPQTNRMLFETRTKPGFCQSCHAGLNGFGFGLENYNAAGHYHTMENGLRIDATGALHGTDVDGPFNGGVALSEALSRSRVVHDCATQEMLRYALGRAATDDEKSTLATLSKNFMDSQGNVRALLTDIVASPSFRLRKVEEN